MLGNQKEALKFHEKALQIHREARYMFGIATNLGFIGIIYYRLGDLEKAMSHFQEALQIHREGGYRIGVANNLSPSGDWNVYRFTSYRQGMREEPAFMTLPFRIKSESYALRLSLELGLDEIILADQALEVAVSAVIKSIDGAMSYWALNHPAPQPDFHRRDSFIIRL
jgi:tetratricopeptide (TPR) repeat protein